MNALENKIAIIAGASSGIGHATARLFAREGAHVILTGRSVGALEALDDEIKAFGGTATLAPFDLKEYGKIEELAAVIAERYGKLDILVGNAAILGTLSPLPHADPKEWEQVMAINVTANWHLIRAFDKLLRASDAGRAIFVTSGVTRGAHAYWGPYATSKAALEMMVNIYAEEMKNTSVRVNLIDPGVVRTSMRASAMPGEDPMTLPHPDDITDAFVELARVDCRKNGASIAA